jgi:hypothetical protein
MFKRKATEKMSMSRMRCDVNTDRLHWLFILQHSIHNEYKTVLACSQTLEDIISMI